MNALCIKSTIILVMYQADHYVYAEIIWFGAMVICPMVNNIHHTTIIHRRKWLNFEAYPDGTISDPV